MAADSTTASAQRRRVTKPLMEKRRRARINMCLAQLKDIVMKSRGNEHFEAQGRASRLEKADILEMTVQYVKGLNGIAPGTSSVTSFHDGYQRCLSEVAEFLSSVDGNRLAPADRTLTQTLIDHLRSVMVSYDKHHNASANVTCSSCRTAQAGSDATASPQALATPVSPACTRWKYAVDEPDVAEVRRNSPGEEHRLCDARPTVLVEPSSSRNVANDRQLPPKGRTRHDAPCSEPLNKIATSEQMWRPW